MNLKGKARCSASENIIKTKEAAISEKPRIKAYFGDQTMPTSKLSPFRYVHNPTWCNFGEPCKDGAVLPTITVNNMRGKLPPKDRGNVAIGNLGSTRMS